MWSRLKRTVPPGSTPVSVDEIKANSRVDFADDDAFIGDLINEAVAKIDGVDGIGYCMMDQTWTLTLDGFPSGEIVLPLVPFLSLTSIKYVDVDGGEQTVSSSDYRVIDAVVPAVVEPVYGASWPSARSIAASVTVTFKVGFATADEVPADLKRAIKMAVGNWYEHREGTVERHAVRVVPDGVDGILDRYRVGLVAS